MVVAAGGFEQPAVFRYNDLPGIMLASAAQRLIYRYAVKPMHRAVVLTANADGYRAALDLLAHGVAVSAVVDWRADPGQAAPLRRALEAAGVAVRYGQAIVAALATADGQGVRAVQVAAVSAEGDPTGAVETLECDGVAVSVGWAPAANLLYQAGVRMRYLHELEQFVPDQLPDGVFACGRVNGVHELARRIADGQRAGSHAAAAAGWGQPQGEALALETACPTHAWPMVNHPDGRNFVDFDEDLQLKDFHHAVQEGFDNIELLKRFSTVGMGPSQGKHSNMNGLRILARLTGKEPQQVGTTTARPFYHPVPMAILAGRGFTPERRTPLHSRHQALAAQWMPAGVWQRPAYYARPGLDREACIAEEVLAVRQQLGLIDVGTLGKLTAEAIESIDPGPVEAAAARMVTELLETEVSAGRLALPLPHPPAGTAPDTRTQQLKADARRGVLQALDILMQRTGYPLKRAAAALLPVARIALGDRSDEVLGEVVQQFNARMARAGVAL